MTTNNELTRIWKETFVSSFDVQFYDFACSDWGSKTIEPQDSSRWHVQVFGTKGHKVTYDWFVPHSIEHSNLPPILIQSDPDRLHSPCCSLLFKLYGELYPGENVARDCGLSLTASKAEFNTKWNCTCDRDCAFVSWTGRGSGAWQSYALCYLNPTYEVTSLNDPRQNEC